MRIFCLFAAMLALTACDSVVTYGPVQSKSPIPEQHLYIAAEKGAMVAEIHGNPFPTPDPRLANLVRDAMQNAVLGPPVRFVAAPGPDTVDPYKVVVAFNAPPALHYRDICTYNAPTSSAPAAGSMTVTMGFCFGSDRISATWGSVRGATGPDDPKFHALVRQTALTLVPMYQREPEND